MANGNLRLARVLNFASPSGQPPRARSPIPSSRSGRAQLAMRWRSSQSSWDDLDEQALEQALNQLESLDLDQSGTESADNGWVFTQLARGSTELSAMIVDMLPNHRTLHSPQA